MTTIRNTAAAPDKVAIEPDDYSPGGWLSPHVVELGTRLGAAGYLHVAVRDHSRTTAGRYATPTIADVVAALRLLEIPGLEIGYTPPPPPLPTEPGLYVPAGADHPARRDVYELLQAGGWAFMGRTPAPVMHAGPLGPLVPLVKQEGTR